MDLDVGIMFEGVWKNQPDVTVTVIGWAAGELAEQYKA